jgi:hypothetical protein
MRLPRVRSTVRRLMAVVAVVALLLWLILCWDWDTGAAHGVGEVSIPLVFVVSEADSGQPIEGVVIHLQDFDYQSDPIPLGA